MNSIDDANGSDGGLVETSKYLSYDVVPPNPFNQRYAVAVTRWLADAAYNELMTEPFLACGTQDLLRELANRIETGRLELPEALR